MREIKNEEELTEVLKALANPTRLRIVSILSWREMNIYDLSKELKLSYPLTSLHMKKLKRLGLVKEVKEVKSEKGLLPKKYYRTSDFKVDLSPENVREIVEKAKET